MRRVHFGRREVCQTHRSFAQVAGAAGGGARLYNTPVYAARMSTAQLDVLRPVVRSDEVRDRVEQPKNGARFERCVRWACAHHDLFVVVPRERARRKQRV